MLKDLFTNPDIRQVLTKLAAGNPDLVKALLGRVRGDIVMYKDGVRAPFRYPEGLRECYGIIRHDHGKVRDVEENVVKIVTNDAASQ